MSGGHSGVTSGACDCDDTCALCRNFSGVVTAMAAAEIRRQQDTPQVAEEAWAREAQMWGRDTQAWAEATGPAARQAWDASIGLSTKEAVRSAAASAALAGTPVSEEWKADVEQALNQDDPDAALDQLVARRISQMGDSVTRRPCDRCGKTTLFAICGDCEERDYLEGLQPGGEV